MFRVGELPAMATLRERFLGSILGCAVGDALGAPFEGSSSSAVRSRWGRHVRFHPIPGYPLGQYTDDTQLTLAMMRSICRMQRVDGADIANEFIRLWQTDEIVGAGASCTDAVYAMMDNGKSWEEAGTAEGRAGNGSAMRAAPVGLWNYAHPELIEQDAVTSSIITHRDSRSIAGAIAVAKAVQLCVNADRLDPPAFIEEVSHAVRKTSEPFARWISQLSQLLGTGPSEALPHIYGAGNPDFGPRQPGWITAYVVPTVLGALYFFLRTPHDFIESITEAIGAGGDTDTIGAITGAISGAFNGTSSVPAALIADLKDSSNIIALTEQFYRVAASRQPR
ncbi:MAG: hypothetical protein C4532_03905 [Candidatus Abyssobacteria bacterium SURF_17]|uniref:ADP-ribosylglycohydrolase family protein n=1 Tax=Candidatus Abyssobacteria bacterium SURF_17 TaxID=2093361 RepID=A0A419F5Z5_9BACT|nr:MAG: hypothetical protein C4532_03905 [Candidatus Abyssubacteria bacterium SURF_17]